jgi:hypothetical protein
MRLGLDKPFALPPRSLQHSFRPCHCQAPPTNQTFGGTSWGVETGRWFTVAAGRLNDECWDNSAIPGRNLE